MFFSTKIVQPSEANSSSISRLLPAKPPPPQPKPKAHVNAYAVTGPQAYEFSEPNYHSIPSKPAEYETFISTTALYEPVYADADASGKETAAKIHVYHSVEPHGATDHEQYYSDPTSPSQPPDLVPPTHVYHILDSHKDSGQGSTHYEEATLSAYQVCACTIYSILTSEWNMLLGEYLRNSYSIISIYSIYYVYILILI